MPTSTGWEARAPLFHLHSCGLIYRQKLDRIDDDVLRLREAVPADGGPPMRRLARKADVDAATRLITSLYLQPEEFALLRDLPGARLAKTRHHLTAIHGVAVSIDRFHGPLEGLLLAEAEFEDAEALKAFPDPDFAIREVTDDPRYGGGWLVRHGLPD